MGRRLNEVFYAGEIFSSKAGPPPLLRGVWLGSVDRQLMTARSRAGSTEGLYLAAWGGHNAQSHNHNDVGNFLHARAPALKDTWTLRLTNRP
jgi:hypothetical protein